MNIIKKQAVKLIMLLIIAILIIFILISKASANGEGINDAFVHAFWGTNGYIFSLTSMKNRDDLYCIYHRF